MFPVFECPVFGSLLYFFCSGTLAMYELRAGKIQMLTAHTGPIIAAAFSVEGKNLATYSPSDNKLHFWQTSTGMFGLGNAQTKCTRYDENRIDLGNNKKCSHNLGDFAEKFCATIYANSVNFVFIWVPVTWDKVVKVQEPLPNHSIKQQQEVDS